MGRDRRDGPAAAPRAPFGGLEVWIALASAAALHVALALGTDLSPDEAYYLCAARQPGALPPLIDHPPLLPWLLGVTDRLGGLPVELRVRAWPLLLSLGLGLAVVALARDRGAGPRGQAIAAWASSWALLPMAGGFVATPDGPALLGVAAALWWAARPRSISLTAASSVLVALAALSKVALLPVALVAAATATGRSTAARLAWLLPLAATAPLLAPSLSFQLRHAYGPGGPGPGGPLLAVGAVGALILGQLLLWSPWILLRGGRRLSVSSLRRRESSLPACDRALAATFTLLLIGSALVRAVPPEPNWWAPAALVFVIAAATAEDLPPRRRLAMLGFVVVPTVLAAAHVLRPWLPLPERADPTARLHGWSDGTEQAAAPGVGAYGRAAERCVYRRECDEIDRYFKVAFQQDGSRE